ITPLAPISTFPLSLHDALPIFGTGAHRPRWCGWQRRVRAWNAHLAKKARMCSGTQAYPSVSSPTPGRTLLTRCGAFRTRVVTVSMLSPKNLWPVANLRRVSVVQHNAAETSEQQGVLGVAQPRCGGRPHRGYRQAAPRDGELGHRGAVLDGLPGTTKVP